MANSMPLVKLINLNKHKSNCELDIKEVRSVN